MFSFVWALYVCWGGNQDFLYRSSSASHIASHLQATSVSTPTRSENCSATSKPDMWNSEMVLFQVAPTEATKDRLFLERGRLLSGTYLQMAQKASCAFGLSAPCIYAIVWFPNQNNSKVEWFTLLVLRDMSFYCSTCVDDVGMSNSVHLCQLKDSHGCSKAPGKLLSRVRLRCSKPQVFLWWSQLSSFCCVWDPKVLRCF